MTVEFHALDKCKRHDFEDTCQAIQDALDKSEISLPEDADFHHDDVDAIVKWVEAEAEKLHADDDN